MQTHHLELAQRTNKHAKGVCANKHLNWGCSQIEGYCTLAVSYCSATLHSVLWVHLDSS